MCASGRAQLFKAAHVGATASFKVVALSLLVILFFDRHQLIAGL